MGPRRDLTGQIFGQWTVVRLWPERNKHGQILWLCRCSCGVNESLIITGHLRSGGTLRCRTCALAIKKKTKPTGRNRMDLTGKTYGSWTVIGFSHHVRGHASYWLCRCVCGTERPVQGVALRSDRSTQCRDCRNRSYIGVSPQDRGKNGAADQHDRPAVGEVDDTAAGTQ